jgi:GntR family transcriptional regulator, carbon starvation induced regulator
MALQYRKCWKAPDVLHRKAGPRSETEGAYTLLRTELLAGAFTPGERLRPGALQARLDVGLTPIREALTRLGVEGSIVGESQRGFRVGEASLAEFADLMDTRRELERVCLSRAIMRGNAAWEAEIVAAMHLLERTPLPRTPSDRVAADLWEARHRRFHLALVSACDSPRRLQFWQSLYDHVERHRKIRLLRHKEPAARVRAVNAEHQRIMQAVLARDQRTAARLMDADLLATERAVSAILQDVTVPARRRVP